MEEIGQALGISYGCISTILHDRLGMLKLTARWVPKSLSDEQMATRLHFRSDEEVVTAVEEWVNGKDPDFFSSGLMAVEHRWSKCITLEGNYIEKEEWISTRNKLGWLLIDSSS